MEPRNLQTVLAQQPLLRDLEPRHLALLTGCARNVRFDRGAYLAREGQGAETFYLIRSGRVAVELHQPGSPPLTIQTVGPGEFFGWSWLVPPHRWRFDGRAVAPAGALQFAAPCLRAKCEEDHELGYQVLRRLIQMVAGRLEGARLQLLDLYALETRR